MIQESIVLERPYREVCTPGGYIRMFFGESGLDLWLEHSDFPHRFPLPVGRDADWQAIRDAIESLRAEAVESARRENAGQRLIDPIDGPDGEA